LVNDHVRQQCCRKKMSGKPAGNSAKNKDSREIAFFQRLYQNPFFRGILSVTRPKLNPCESSKLDLEMFALWRTGVAWLIGVCRLLLFCWRTMLIPNYPLGWQWCSLELLHTACELYFDWRMVFLPPSMGLSWLSSTLVLTIGFLGTLYIASRVRVILRFSRPACHSFRIAINNFPKLASCCHSFHTDTCFRPGVYYNRYNRPHTVSYVHIVIPRQSMKNFKWHIHLNSRILGIISPLSVRTAGLWLPDCPIL